LASGVAFGKSKRPAIVTGFPSFFPWRKSLSEIVHGLKRDDFLSRELRIRRRREKHHAGKEAGTETYFHFVLP